jgi:hypothetical protein
VVGAAQLAGSIIDRAQFAAGSPNPGSPSAGKGGANVYGAVGFPEQSTVPEGSSLTHGVGGFVVVPKGAAGFVIPSPVDGLAQPDWKSKGWPLYGTGLESYEKALVCGRYHSTMGPSVSG